ncbi:MAG: PrsW family intramembrane metalloprotease, partial [Chloroflexi bacterium]|nr:PrsW family intramembrane metalloprotease [Chloroflexota bacterium]
MAYQSPPLSRSLIGSPLQRRPVGCLFWSGILVLSALALLSHAQIWLQEPTGAVLVFMGTIALATVVALPVLWLLRLLDRLEREPMPLFIGSLLWGAIISTGLSGLLNSLGAVALTQSFRLRGDDGESLGRLLTATLVAPPVEEAAKGLGILLLFWFLRAEFDNLRDGLIYGSLVGLGFNIAETALYVMHGYVETGAAPLGQQLAVRFVFLGLNGHLIFSALFGAGLGLARQTSRRWLRLVSPLVGYGLAVLAHALSNSLGVLLFTAIVSGLGFGSADDFADVPVASAWFAAVIADLISAGWVYIVLGILLGLSARWERAIIRLFLADEVGTAVTAAEYAAIKQTIPILNVPAFARSSRGI